MQVVLTLSPGLITFSIGLIDWSSQLKAVSSTTSTVPSLRMISNLAATPYECMCGELVISVADCEPPCVQVETAVLMPVPGMERNTGPNILVVAVLGRSLR